ncbi:NnrS family protein [Ralstonia pseudosolanacearum]|uniref:Putative transmembrane protein n=1 Tax=Ralstonia solanacearum TaxID=305 RepID=A0A0S4TRW5_RALSL|nr:short-chain dehydrogenase [Ralstonia solanacearum]CUV12802.1 putative transmembrane protein [Ralstonia solanacearum]
MPRPAPLLNIGQPDPASRVPYTGLPVFALGFRPFYLLAAAFAVIGMALWAGLLLGGFSAAHGPMLPPLFWHAHEMVFGVAAAAVVGFLFTAGKNWTGLQTPQGPLLAALAAVWLAARVLMWTGPGPLAVAVDVAFLPLCGVLFLRILRRAANARNYGLAAALLILGAVNAGFHFALMAGAPLLALRCVDAAAGLVAMFVTVIGGRVIPMFSTNAIPGIRIRRAAWAERAIVPLTLAAVIVLALPVSGVVPAVVFASAAVAQVVRWAGWNSVRTLRTPIVAILHVAYGFLPLGVGLLAVSALGGIDRSTALHALTVGAIGGAIVAMITRTALGHTGRPLRAGHAERLAYAAIALAALVRVAGPLLLPRGIWIGVSSAGWVVAFAIYLWKYTPWLLAPRVDGRDG